MKLELLLKVDPILEAVLDAEKSIRSNLIEELCGPDQGLRTAVEELLAIHDTQTTEKTESMLAFFKKSNGELLAQNTRLGSYKVDRCIGSGGMGDVYLAHRCDGQFERKVAIKTLNEGLRTEVARQAFSHEIRILSQLSHPNIAQLFDTGYTEQGNPYLIMAFFESQPITDFVTEHELGLKERISLFIEVCKAIQYAHNHRVIHCDIKPGNVLVTDEGLVKVVDFGIAQVLGQDENQSKKWFTPEYASPEQIQGKACSNQSDIYGLGVLLKKLLKGLKLPRDLTIILECCTYEKPDDRFDSVAALIRELRAFLNLRPISIRPNQWSYRIGLFFKRAPIQAAAISSTLLLIFVLVMGLVVFNGQVQNKNQALEKEHNLTLLSQQFLTDVFELSDPAQNSRDRTALGLLKDWEDTIRAHPTLTNVERSMHLINLSTYFEQLGFYEETFRVLNRIPTDSLGEDEKLQLDVLFANNAFYREDDALFQKKISELTPRLEDPQTEPQLKMLTNLLLALRENRLHRRDIAEELVRKAWGFPSQKTKIEKQRTLQLYLGAFAMRAEDWHGALQHFDKGLASNIGDQTTFTYGKSQFGRAKAARHLGQLELALEAINAMHDWAVMIPIGSQFGEQNLKCTTHFEMIVLPHYIRSNQMFQPAFSLYLKQTTLTVCFIEMAKIYQLMGESEYAIGAYRRAQEHHEKVYGQDEVYQQIESRISAVKSGDLSFLN